MGEGLGLAEERADTILKAACVGGVHYALIDDGECQTVSVGCRAISCKRRNSCHRSCLGEDIAPRERALHA